MYKIKSFQQTFSLWRPTTRAAVVEPTSTWRISLNIFIFSSFRSLQTAHLLLEHQLPLNHWCCSRSRLQLLWVTHMLFSQWICPSGSDSLTLQRSKTRHLQKTTSRVVLGRRLLHHRDTSTQRTTVLGPSAILSPIHCQRFKEKQNHINVILNNNTNNYDLRIKYNRFWKWFYLFSK